MSSLLARGKAILPIVGATDLTAKRGALVTLSDVGGVLTATLSASATVKAKGVVLDGAPTTAKSSIGILGALDGTVYMKAGGAITQGDFVQQGADETIATDAGAGARVLVGVALQTGVSGDLIEVAPLAPLTLA